MPRLQWRQKNIPVVINKQYNLSNLLRQSLKLCMHMLLHIYAQICKCNIYIFMLLSYKRLKVKTEARYISQSNKMKWKVHFQKENKKNISWLLDYIENVQDFRIFILFPH